MSWLGHCGPVCSRSVVSKVALVAGADDVFFTAPPHPASRATASSTAVNAASAPIILVTSVSVRLARRNVVVVRRERGSSGDYLLSLDLRRS